MQNDTFKRKCTRTSNKNLGPKAPASFSMLSGIILSINVYWAMIMRNVEIIKHELKGT